MFAKIHRPVTYYRVNKSYAVTSNAWLKISPLNSFGSVVLRILAGSVFHATCPETENARSPNFVRGLGSTQSGDVEDRRWETGDPDGG